MFARSMGSLVGGMVLLVLLCGVAAAKPRIAILGLEVIGSLDPEQVKLARQLTNGLRERASAGTGPFELAPSSDKELVDEKLMNGCESEALTCMAPIGLALRADYLMYGKIEKVDRGYHVTIKLLRIATKTPLPTFSDIVSVADLKNDWKSLAKRAYAMMTATDEGTVTVRVGNVERAVVFIDDQPMGTTSSGMLTISVPEGRHRLAVVANEKGWKRHEVELTVNAGDQRNIPINLVRAEEPRSGAPPANPSGTLPPELTPGGTGVVGGGETRTRGSSGGGGGWTGVAIGGTVLTVASAAGFALSWYELSALGKVEGDNRTNPFAYSCTPEDLATRCKDGDRYEKLSYVTGIGAVVLGSFTVYAFYKGATGKERPGASARSARARGELTMTPVLSAQGGGATLRIDW
jgi:hypothetical protein